MEFTMSQFISKEEMYEYEIERLNELNAELLAAAKKALAYNDAASSPDGLSQFSWAEDLRSAIAKAERP
jgi:hypothetical protein